MNGLNEESLSPQTFLYGCVLEAGKEVVFNPDDDGFEHQLDLRMACVDPGTKDQLHTVEVEGQDSKGQKVKAVLAALKPSTLPSVCLGGFTISHPAVFRLKAGPGPVHISGQHLIMMESDQSFDEEEEEDEEEEIQTSKKRPASSPAPKPQKKMKVEMDEDDEEDEEDEDEDDEEDEEESEVEESPVKAKATPAKQKNPQNGKSPAPSTPAPSTPAPSTPTPSTPTPKQAKTPKSKGEKSPKTPSPEANLTLPEIKAKLMQAVKKGVSLPKIQAKFENLLKNSLKISDPKFIAELWKWRENMGDGQ